MKIKVDSQITIEGINEDVLKYCKNVLTIKNPEIEKKKRMGFWTGNTPKLIKMYSINSGNYILPLGCLNDIWNLYPYIENYVINFGNHKKLNFPENNLKLYDYQEQAVNEMLKAKRGILESKCR